MIIVVISLMLSNVFCWYVSLMSHFVTSQTSYFFFKISFLYIKIRFYICLSHSFFISRYGSNFHFHNANSILNSMTNTLVPLAPRGEKCFNCNRMQIPKCINWFASTKNKKSYTMSSKQCKQICFLKFLEVSSFL